VLRQALRASGAALALGALLDEVLEFALTSLHAERGNVQLADPATGALTIAAQRGFGPEFAEYFAAVTDDGSACGRAARHHAQVVITDVTTDPGFAPHREIALASGFRAVQSTPLVNRAGYLVGMLSTHYPGRPLRRSVTCRPSAASGRWPASDSARCSTGHRPTALSKLGRRQPTRSSRQLRTYLDTCTPNRPYWPAVREGAPR
jgi:hypothetical protein